MKDWLLWLPLLLLVAAIGALGLVLLAVSIVPHWCAAALSGAGHRLVAISQRLRQVVAEERRR